MNAFIDFTFSILVIMSFPVLGAPFALVNNISSYCKLKNKLNLKSIPRPDMSDLLFSGFVGFLVFVISTIFWWMFNLPALFTYIMMFCLSIMSEGWELAVLYSEEKKFPAIQNKSQESKEK